MLALVPVRLSARPRAGARRAGAPRRVASAPLCAQRPTVAFVTEKNTPDVEVRFTLQKHVPFGQELVVIGDAAELGAWDLGAAVRMSWSEGDLWHATVRLPAGAGVEFKFVQSVPNSAPQWESCLNRTLCVDDYTTDLTCVWAAPLATVAQPAAPGSAAAAPGGVESEEDAPAPAFKPAAALAQFADALKQSFNGTSSGDAPVAEGAAPAAQQPSLLAAATEAVSTPFSIDHLGPPAVHVASPAPAAPAASKAQGKPEGAKEKEVRMSAAAEAAVSDIIEGAGPTAVGVPADGAAAPAVVDAGGEELAETPAAVSKSGGTALKTLGTAVGTVAMGVGAAAMLSTLAIDIGDVALLGAMAAGSVAALSTPSTASGKKARNGRRGKAAAGANGAAGATVEDEAAAEAASAVETEMIAQKGSAPGVILAAGMLSAFDVGRKMLADVADGQAENAAAAAARKKNEK